ncbi:hypothetical protein Tco_0018523 [Tanacetum coccineum]
MQAARDRQKSYAYLKRKLMEFQVGDKVMLKISPWKGVVRFGKRGKLNPAVPLDRLYLDDKLHFVEEPLEIVGREVKRLKQSRIPLVKVRWNSKRGPEFTWEREDQFKKKYPHLFTKTAPSSSVTSEFHNEASSGWRIDELLDLRLKVAFDLLRDALSAIFGLSELKLLEHAPPSLEYIPDPIELEDHVPVYIPEPEHPEDLVPAEDEAPTPLLPLSFLSPRIRPLSPRALETHGCEIGESSAAAAARQPGPTMAHRVDHSHVEFTVSEFGVSLNGNHDAQKDRAAVRAEIEVLRRERLAYDQEGMETIRPWARSEAYYRALEARVTVLETEVRHHEVGSVSFCRYLVVQISMRTQALEAGARVDTLEDTGSSS